MSNALFCTVPPREREREREREKIRMLDVFLEQMMRAGRHVA